MRFHGLVLLAVIGLTESIWAQNGLAPTADLFLPPSPRKSEEGKNEPLPLPLTSSATDSSSMVDIEMELRQFRSELREFQSVREEVARSTRSADADADRVSMQQRQELVELLTKLAKRRVAKKAPNPPVVAEPTHEPPPVVPTLQADPPSAIPMLPTESATADVSVDIADAFALGKVLFRTGDFVGAERAFRKATVTPENEMTLKYLLATCLRRQSRWQPAIDTYKVVAGSNQDPVLRDLAKWQLDNIRWLQESETQLDKMRKQREKQSNVTNGQSASLGQLKQ